MFTSTFERQTDAPDQASKIEKLMDQYVNEQLAAEKRKWQQQALAKRGAVVDAVAAVADNQADNDAATAAGRTASINAELYAMLPNASAAGATSTVTGSWAAGIEEVELPVEYKMRNIEETAKATQALAQRSHRHGNKAERAPSNFSSYSASFSKYHANANNSTLFQDAGKASEQPALSQSAAAPTKHRHASDHQAMSKFKANMRR